MSTHDRRWRFLLGRKCSRGAETTPLESVWLVDPGGGGASLARWGG